jgi:hypothetical protein
MGTSVRQNAPPLNDWNHHRDDGRVVEKRGHDRDGDHEPEGNCPYEAMIVGVEFKGVRGGVERRRGASGLKPSRGGRRDAPGEKVLKERRSQRERGRTATSVMR